MAGKRLSNIVETPLRFCVYCVSNNDESVLRAGIFVGFIVMSPRDRKQLALGRSLTSMNEYTNTSKSLFSLP